MNAFEKTIRVFPSELQYCFAAVPSSLRETVQELRLYSGYPLTLSVRGKRYFLSANGDLTDHPRQGILCKPEWITQTFDCACDYSVYAHQHELRNGYVTAKNGIRIGIAGTAVQENGQIVSFRDITSLCVRVARQHRGCAAQVANRITQNGIHSALICGEPSSGKTSFLKDLIAQFCEQGIAVSVIDERDELSIDGTGIGCDVLRDCPKSAGIESAIRALAPQILVLDELGEDDIQSIVDGFHRAVPTVATVHCRNLTELRARPLLLKALERGVFSFIFFLKGRDHPGTIAQYVKTEEWLYEMDRRSDDPVCLFNDGILDAVSYAKAGDNITTHSRANETIDRTDPLYQRTDHRTDTTRSCLVLSANDRRER